MRLRLITLFNLKNSMVKMIKVIIYTCLAIGITHKNLNAELIKVAQSGYQFLKIDADARAAGMGGAYTLVGTGASSMFYNPAGMAEGSQKLDFFSTQTNWLADIQYYSMGITKKLGGFGTIGFSILTSDYGEIIGTRVEDNTAGFVETGNVNVTSSALGLSFAKNLTDQFSVGGQIKYVSQNLGKTLVPDGSEKLNETDGLAYDFGTIYYPGLKSFCFGIP